MLRCISQQYSESQEMLPSHSFSLTKHLTRNKYWKHLHGK